mmetsp:Transcript_6111/g.12454  ORF Transcript_6111/g.12454 Transcript_6111/m.12454 type:complete len:84 (-) Transcript_6111:157-408(-)
MREKPREERDRISTPPLSPTEVTRRVSGYQSQGPRQDLRDDNTPSKVRKLALEALSWRRGVKKATEESKEMKKETKKQREEKE